MTTNMLPFEYEANVVRVFLMEDGEPLWIARDVCKVLNIIKYRDALARLDDDQRSCPVRVDTKHGSRKMATVTESGLYDLILRSDKPEAKIFRKWVTKEVLPQIRKTGRYAVAAKRTYTGEELIDSLMDGVQRERRVVADLRKHIACQEELLKAERLLRMQDRAIEGVQAENARLTKLHGAVQAEIYGRQEAAQEALFKKDTTV